jgi:hypothetical protein
VVAPVSGKANSVKEMVEMGKKDVGYKYHIEGSNVYITSSEDPEKVLEAYHRNLNPNVKLEFRKMDNPNYPASYAIWQVEPKGGTLGAVYFTKPVKKAPALSEADRKEAYELGQQAYKDGKPGAPVMNKKIMDKVQNGNPDRTSALLEAYNKGWTAANVAAPVPGVTDSPEWKAKQVPKASKKAGGDYAGMTQAQVEDALLEDYEANCKTGRLDQSFAEEDDAEQHGFKYTKRYAAKKEAIRDKYTFLERDKQEEQGRWMESNQTKKQVWVPKRGAVAPGYEFTGWKKGGGAAFVKQGKYSRQTVEVRFNQQGGYYDIYRGMERVGTAQTQESALEQAQARTWDQWAKENAPKGAQ